MLKKQSTIAVQQFDVIGHHDYSNHGEWESHDIASTDDAESDVSSSTCTGCSGRNKWKKQVKK